MIAVVAIVLALSSVESFAMPKKGCSELLAKAKLEIAELLLEKSKAEGEADGALRSLLEKNLKLKIEEYAVRFGVELDAGEMRDLVARIEKGFRERRDEKDQKERRTREKESSSIAIAKKVFTKVMGELHQLDDMYFTNADGIDNDDIAGSGVQWGDDEKYVVFRNFEQQSWIYDTEKKEFLDYRPSTGIISGRGHLYAENGSDQTSIRDLDTSERWGPFKGNPMHSQELFNGDFIILSFNERLPNSSRKSIAHTLVDFRTGREIKLGADFAISKDQSLIVRKNGVEKIEVLEVATGKVKKTYAVEKKDRMLSWVNHGFFTFKKNSKLHLVLLSNLRVFELPFKSEPYGISADEKKLFFKQVKGRSDEESVVIYDLATGKSTKFEGLSEFTLSPDGMHAVIHEFETKETVWVDLATMQRRGLPGDYKRWSQNGRWVYNKSSGGAWRHDLFDLNTGQKVSFKAGFDFNFIGLTNYALTESSNASKVFISDMSQWTGDPFSLLIGHKEAKPSPSGRFILTYDQAGKVTFSEVGVR